jgi:hypothetical protein
VRTPPRPQPTVGRGRAKTRRKGPIDSPPVNLTARMSTSTGPSRSRPYVQLEFVKPPEPHCPSPSAPSSQRSTPTHDRAISQEADIVMLSSQEEDDDGTQ